MRSISRFLSGAAMLLTTAGQAQQNTFPYPQYGNVGLGTGNAPPAANLHLVGKTIENTRGFTSEASAITGTVQLAAQPQFRIDAAFEVVHTNVAGGSAPNVFEIRHSFASGATAKNSIVANTAGNVGINAVPAGDEQLAVGGNLVANGAIRLNGNLELNYNTPAYSGFRSIIGHSYQKGLSLYGGNNDADGAGLILSGNGCNGKYGAVTMIAGDGASNSGDVAFEWLKYNSGSYATLMQMRKAGQLLIGDPGQLKTLAGQFPDAASYRLVVAHGILTPLVRVAVPGTASWADFVFARNYKLAPLSQVGAFIEEHHHLPGIPSAEQVVKEGLDLAGMDARLLQKIEELTLYLLEQDKKIASLQAEVDRLKSLKQH